MNKQLGQRRLARSRVGEPHLYVRAASADRNSSFQDRGSVDQADLIVGRYRRRRVVAHLDAPRLWRVRSADGVETLIEFICRRFVERKKRRQNRDRATVVDPVAA